MKYEIDYYNETEHEIDFFEKDINDLTELVLTHLNKTESYTLAVTIVSTKTIQEINRDYRDKDAITDVISFALQDYVEGELAIKGLPEIELGDIFICFDRAKDQANDYGHSIKRELNFLFLHGLLHLLGYDHLNDEEEKVMFGLQDEILEKAKIHR